MNGIRGVCLTALPTLLSIMRKLLLPLALLLGACNDLTAPTPSIAGEYLYVAATPANANSSRRGTIKIFDDNLLTARFNGTFEYVDGVGQTVSGQLQGAFISGDSIWFQFLDERAVYHEASFTNGIANGSLFFQGFSYEDTGWTFMLTRVRPAPRL